MAFRADMIFSYWIFAWYILYKCKITQYSPKLLLLIGLLENVLVFFLMLIFNTYWKTILGFLFINTFIKVLPLVSLKKESIHTKDIWASILLFLLYVLYLYLHKENVTVYQKKILESLLYNKSKTPFFQLVKALEDYVRHLR
jgi:hypothetical protein